MNHSKRVANRSVAGQIFLDTFNLVIRSVSRSVLLLFFFCTSMLANAEYESVYRELEKKVSFVVRLLEGGKFDIDGEVVDVKNFETEFEKIALARRKGDVVIIVKPDAEVRFLLQVMRSAEKSGRTSRVFMDTDGA